ncbi:MAG TPA: hypothetical protein PKC30_14985 [Saprospiraceae bacterium]|nr:hypothetical protein [Saprospiraceae bacterium]
MGFLKFNRVPKHRKFEYIPRYYDPKKEELDKIVDSYKLKNDSDATRERIRSGLRNKYRGDQSYKKSQNRSSNIRLASIIILLFFISYMILRSETILRMLETFLGQ